jgi:hypothetical protein
MRAFEVELPVERGSQPEGSQERQGGVCRLGDALSELLALYPPVIEWDEVDVVASWPASAVEHVACDIYSASRA